MASESVSKDYETLRDDVKKLRSDVATLAEALVAEGKGRARAVKASAVDQARQRLDRITSQAQTACDRGRETVETVERQVAEHPCKSLSIVFGSGVFIGMILSWILGRR